VSEAANGHRALRRQGKAPEVIDRLSTMRLSDSEVAVVARLLLSAGDNARATDLLRRLSERRKPAGPRWAQLDLALSYLVAGNYEKAAAQSQVLIAAPQFAGAAGREAASAWSVIGIAKARLGQSGAAGDPLPTSYVGLAQVLLRTGRAEEAVSELAAAGKKLGPNFLISYFQGLALDRAARPAEAISAFQDAIRLNPGSSEAHLGLGKTE